MNEYEAMCEAYREDCEKCLNKGILEGNRFCDCTVGMSESLMGVSAEADALMMGEVKNSIK